MRVLIVDDSTAMRLLVKRALREAGFDGLDLSEAKDGNEAFACMEDIAPHLVLSDWNMPNLDGLGLLEKIRAADMTTKFGFVTTESTPDMREKAMSAGADFMIAKPFNSESFQEALSGIIG